MRGGKRKGAGRKPGSANKRTREIANLAFAKGIMPLEYMLELLRAAPPKNASEELKVEIEARRFEAAKAAAPYVHPRLQAVEFKADGPFTVQHEISMESQAEFGKRLAFLLEVAARDVKAKKKQPA